MAAASWLLTAAREGGSMNAVSDLPVAYPGGAPISSPALVLARRTVASCSSTNSGTGALLKTARSKVRSALSESAGAAEAESPVAASASLASASTAASSSANEASSRARGSAPGMAAAWRSASRRSARPLRSAELSAHDSCGISPDRFRWWPPGQSIVLADNPHL
jgi:hypothetical protein